MIIQLAGLPATGKSTIAAKLAARLGGLLLDKDSLRDALFGPHHVTYTRTQDDACIDVMLHAAAWMLTTTPSSVVILDGRTCYQRYQVHQIQRFADTLDQPLRIIECVCPEHVARTRLDHDAAARAHVAANRDYTLYRTLKATADPIPHPKLVVNTDTPLTAAVSRCLHYVADDHAHQP